MTPRYPKIKLTAVIAKRTVSINRGCQSDFRSFHRNEMIFSIILHTDTHTHMYAYTRYFLYRLDIQLIYIFIRLKL